MRILLSVVAATIVASPAVAAERSAPPPKPTAEAVVGALQNPLVQDALSQVIVNAANAVLATRVGPLAHYADGVRPDDTIADVQRRRNPDFDRRLRDGTHGAVAATARAGGDAVAMAGEMRATADRLRAALAPVMAALDNYRGE